MTHIHWVTRQNKLEIPRDKDEVNKREIHECDSRGWQAQDPNQTLDFFFIFFLSSQGGGKKEQT
jgi:hypothetical protein